MDEYREFVQAHPILVFGFLGILGLIVWTELGRFTRKYVQLGVNEAVRLLNQDNTICLDVREDKELGDGFINNAKHIPLGELQTRITELNNAKQKPILVYCRSGSRSGQACNMLTKEGFENVSNLAGGIMAWEAANLPLSKR
jgi:rhodanese-related sulfurtransferase